MLLQQRRTGPARLQVSMVWLACAGYIFNRAAFNRTSAPCLPLQKQSDNPFKLWAHSSIHGVVQWSGLDGRMRAYSPWTIVPDVETQRSTNANFRGLDDRLQVSLTCAISLAFKPAARNSSQRNHLASRAWTYHLDAPRIKPAPITVRTVENSPTSMTHARSGVE